MDNSFPYGQITPNTVTHPCTKGQKENRTSYVLAKTSWPGRPSQDVWPRCPGQDVMSWTGRPVQHVLARTLRVLFFIPLIIYKPTAIQLH